MSFWGARTRLLSTSAFVGVALFTGGQALAADAAAASDTQVGELVVTGSHIRTDTFTAPVPLATVTSDQVKNSGSALLGDILKDLPQIDANTNNQNSSSTLFLAGQTRVDIRGLGAARTLVLVDGRRHVNSDASSPAVDINMIPSMMIDHAEVITGAASAIYGSDAIAGVVNFIMKKRFDGIQLDAQGGVAQAGDGQEYRFAFLAGHSYAGDKLHVLVGGEYARQEPIMQGDRDWSYPGIRRNTLVSPQTILNPTNRATTSPFGTFELKATNSTATAYAVTEDVRDRTNIVKLSPECSTTTAQPTCQDPSLFYSAIYNALRGDVKRGSVRGYAEYEITPTTKAFSEFTYASTHGYGIFQPAFSTTAGGGLLIAKIAGDNAYLNGPGANAAALRGFWTDAGLGFTSASKANFGKFWNEFGGRNVESDRDTYRFVAGMEGDLSFNNIHWDFYGQYGAVQGTTISYGVPNIQKLLNSIDAVKNGSGQIVCRINQTTVTDAACQPWDILNGGSAGAIAYANAQSTTTSKVREWVVSGNVTGDLFKLPAGPLAFAVGAEYRYEGSSFAQDALGASGALFINSIGTRAGNFDVREVYGELDVPILKDMPFTKHLSFNLAGRLSDYSTVRRTETWRIAGEWSPIEDIKFRAAVGTAVRAPNIVELYSPQSQNFTTSANDPCDKAQYAGASAAQQAQLNVTCAASVPGWNAATFVSNFGTGRPSLQLLQGGNPNLGPETANTKQVGVVVQPHWIPNLSFSFDYFDYNVTNYITTLPTQTALNACYQSSTPVASNPVCSAIVRDPSGANTGVVGGVTLVELVNLNAAFLHVQGYDISAAYGFEINGLTHSGEDQGRVSMRVDATHMWDYVLQSSSVDTPFNFAGYTTTSTPRWKMNLTVQYKIKKLTLGWQSHFIDAMASTNAVAPAAYSPFYTPNYWTHDLRASYKINDRYQVRGGIQNIADTPPPALPETYTGTGGAATYDNRGRFFYVGATANF